MTITVDRDIEFYLLIGSILAILLVPLGLVCWALLKAIGRSVSESKLEMRYVIARVLLAFGFLALANSTATFYMVLFKYVEFDHAFAIPALLFVTGMLCLFFAALFGCAA